MYRFTGNPKRELTDYLGEFGITVFDSNDLGDRSDPSFMMGDVHEDVVYYRVLLEAVKLLNPAAYESKTFNRLKLWGNNPCYHPTDSGYFKDGDVAITLLAQRQTFLGIAYTYLHEFGHTVEFNYPRFPNRVLHESYYQQRDRCAVPNFFHDFRTGDLIMFFALASQQDIDSFYTHNPFQARNIAEFEKLRKEIVGDPLERKNQMLQFIDIVDAAENLRGDVSREKWGKEATARYVEALHNLRLKLSS